MKHTSETRDPAGTAVAVIGGAGCALIGFMAFGPLGALVMGLIGGVGAKKEGTKQVAQELDEIAKENSDEMANVWLSRPGSKSATVTTTKYTGALISLPQTRIHHYHKDADEIVLPMEPSLVDEEAPSEYYQTPDEIRESIRERLLADYKPVIIFRPNYLNYPFSPRFDSDKDSSENSEETS